MNIPEEPPYRMLFSYQHVTGVPLCPCRDPGNYLSAEQSEVNPLNLKFRCWCGRTTTGLMDDQAELDDFLRKNGVIRGETSVPTQPGGSEPR